MAFGYVLISVSPSYENDVHDQLNKIQEIKELYPLFGDYDFIAKLEVKDYRQIGHIVVHKIRAIDGILDSKTLIGLKM